MRRPPVVAPRPRTKARRSSPLAPTSTRRLHAYALGAAVLVGALLIGLSELSVHRGGPAPAPSEIGVTGIAATAAMLDGIQQRGNVLGSAAAPVRLVEYADPQCPYCAQFARDVLPTLVQDYVRTGKVQIVLRGLRFLGPDSETALRTATAAGTQARMWNVLELLYRNQGPENAWVDDALLRSIVAASGASPARVFASRDGVAVTRTIEAWASRAQAEGVNAVPAFFAGPRGGRLQRLPIRALAVSEFRTALDRLLAP